MNEERKISLKSYRTIAKILSRRLKYLKLYFVCLFSIMTCETALSQSAVKGEVVDDESFVDYFNTFLISPQDSSVVQYGTFYDGRFFMTVEPNSSYILKLTSLGYQDKIISFDSVKKMNDTELDLGKVRLFKQDYSLQEVVVSARRPTIISKADRIIVNVQGSILSGASDGMEMLQKTPGLINNGSGGVIIAGKGEPIYYIDGKQVRSIQEIEMLNPQNIKSIEVVTNPSSVFSADGHAVVLINTIKQLEDRFLRFGGTYIQGRKGRKNLYTEGQLIKKRLVMNLYYGFQESNNKTYETNIRNVSDVDQIKSNANSLGETQRNQFRFSTDYIFSQKHTLGFQSDGFYTISNSNREQDTQFTDGIAQPFSTISQTDGHSSQINGTLSYIYKIDTIGQSLKVIADITFNNNVRNQNYYNIYYDSHSPFINRNNSNGTNSIYSVSADYIRPINKKTSMELGVKYYSINGKNNLDQSGNINLIQNYESNEKNIALYFSVSTKLSDKLHLTLGLRSENDSRKGLNNTITYVDTTHFNLFPSLNLNYRYSSKFVMGLSYTKRISRPPLSALDPSLIVDSLMNRKGNPELNSTMTHAFQASLSMWNSLNIQIGYNYLINPFYFMVYQDNVRPEMTNVRINNGANTHSYVFSAFYDKNLTRWWSLSLYGSIWQNKYNYLDNGIEKTNDRPNWNSSISSTFSLPWKLTMDIGYIYYGGGSGGTIVEKSTSNLYGSIRRNFINKNLMCRLSVNDLLNKSTTQQQSVLNGKNLNTYDADDTYVRLSISYQLGKSKYQYRSKSISQEERNRL